MLEYNCSKEHIGMRGKRKVQDSGEAQEISRGPFHEATQSKKCRFYSIGKENHNIKGEQ